jgi:hypothetical protein
MKKILPGTKLAILIAMLLLAAMFTTQAQDKTKVIGNKPRSGKANSSFDIAPGKQVGVKMRAGHKPVQLLQLNFDAESLGTDSLKFKVNVYKFNNLHPGENLVKQPIIGALTNGKHRVSVDLAPYNIIASSNILVAIEWLQSSTADHHFAIGLFNGGTYCYENGKWKKIPIMGVDFNVLVRKVE